ncbi:MAG: hypothetical protein M1368_01340, partial [Thaumarchaeota archaeon]|nr:hypothetical protein [Nitrososphaerota archaeon]
GEVRKSEHQRKFDKSRIYQELVSAASKLNAPAVVVEDALNICSKLIDSDFVIGRRCCTTVLASFYASCRMNEFPIALKDLARVDQTKKVDWRNIAHCYRMIVEEMQFKIPVADPSRYLQPIARNANSSQNAITLSRALIAEAKIYDEGSALGGKDPRAVAAAALYTTSLAIGDVAREKDLADAAGITESAVRRSVMALRKMRFVKIWLNSVKNC